MHGIHGSRGLALCIAGFLLLPAALSACGMLFVLERPSGERNELVPGSTTRLVPRALYSIYFTIPITECFVLTVDVRVGDQGWDNGLVLPLQPMNKLVWKEDYDAFALVAAGIFRADEPGSYRITVTYRDEQLPEALVYVLELVSGS